MHFCDLTQDARVAFFNQLFRGVLDFTGSAARQPQSQRFAVAVEPINKGFPRQNRRRGHGDIRLGSWTLFDVDLAPVLEKRLLDHAGIGKLIRQRPWTSRFFRQQILNHSRMSPAKQPVQVSEFRLELIVYVGIGKRVGDRCGLFPVT